MEDYHIEYLLNLEKKKDIEGIRVFLHGMVSLSKMCYTQAQRLYEYFCERRTWHRTGVDVWCLLDQFRLLSISYNNPVKIGNKFYKKHENGRMEIQTLEQFVKEGGTLELDWIPIDGSRDFDSGKQQRPKIEPTRKKRAVRRRSRVMQDIERRVKLLEEPRRKIGIDIPERTD